MEFSVQLPSYLYGNRTQGLCGVCAGYQDQLVTSNGTVTDDFEIVSVYLRFFVFFSDFAFSYLKKNHEVLKFQYYNYCTILL